MRGNVEHDTGARVNVVPQRRTVLYFERQCWSSVLWLEHVLYRCTISRRQHRQSMTWQHNTTVAVYIYTKWCGDVWTCHIESVPTHDAIHDWMWYANVRLDRQCAGDGIRDHCSVNDPATQAAARQLPARMKCESVWINFIFENKLAHWFNYVFAQSYKPYDTCISCIWYG